jgi:GNAT superfamily N-acetyltransferase
MLVEVQVTVSLSQTPVFRQATVEDIPAMSAIRLSVTENTLSDPSRITRKMYEDYLELCGRGWVAELDGAVVAFCYADSNDGSIWALFVNPAYEGRGLAKGLLALAVDWLFGLGLGFVRLSTGADTRAARFYALQGWRPESVKGTNVHYVLKNAAMASEAVTAN